MLQLPPYHCIFNPIEQLWSFQKHLVRTKSTVRTGAEAVQDRQASFKAVPQHGIEPYFDHVQKEEEKHWRLDGLSEHVIAPVIISLDSDDDYDDENSDEEEF